MNSDCKCNFYYQVHSLRLCMSFIQMEMHKQVAVSKPRKDQNLIESFMLNLRVWKAK